LRLPLLPRWHRLGFKGMHDGKNPLLIAHGTALTTVFIIVLLLTRLVAAGVGTVALSFGASFGPSMLVWQHPIATRDRPGHGAAAHPS
jgi:hypothetical protein